MQELSSPTDKGQGVGGTVLPENRTLDLRASSVLQREPPTPLPPARNLRAGIKEGGPLVRLPPLGLEGSTGLP